MNKIITNISLVLCAVLLLSSCKKNEVDDTKNDTPVANYTNIELGSQNNPKGCFLSLTKGLVYTTATAYDNQSDVDLVFWYNRDTGGASSTATWFTSPAGTMSYYGAYHQEAFIFSDKGLNNWQTLTTTEIGHLAITSGQFDAIETVGQLSTAFHSDDRIFGDAISPKVNDILRFKTYNGKLAIMRIRSITGNAQSTNGMMVIDIKGQP